MNIPYEQIADTLLAFSVAVSAHSAEIAEKADFKDLNAQTHGALFREVFAYNLSVAIANVMIKRHLLGRDDYNQIEKGIFKALGTMRTSKDEDLTLVQHTGVMAQFWARQRTSTDEALALVQHRQVFAPANREIAQRYFLKDADGLRISDEQIEWYAAKYDTPKIKDIPADQIAMVYYTMRIARLLATGRDIDKFIVYYVNNILLDRAIELQNAVCKSLQ